MNQSMVNIHPDAKVAKSAVVEPFATVQKDVEIGEGTWIGPNVTIMEGARIGKNVQIYPGAVVSGTPQDLKFQGEKTTAFIGDNTVIRECVTISRGTSDKETTIIGKNCLIMAYAHVAHDCVIGDHVILSNAVQVAGHVEIEEHAIIGGTSAIHQFGKIGKHAFVGGGSLVRKDIPPFVIAAKEPISFAGVNLVGLRRRGFTNDQIHNIQEVYRYIYNKGFNYTEAIKAIKEELPATEERDLILRFVEGSDRGIMKGGNDA